MRFSSTSDACVIEAKRERADMPAVLDPARRYAQTFRLASTELASGAPYGGGWSGEAAAYRVLLVFATNGRPYVKQLETKSGVRF
jgi:type I restriction enzyme, R subunit